MGNKSVIDIILDEDDNQNVFIKDEKGIDFEFEQVALIPLDEDQENMYVILHPVTKIDGVEDDEALVFVIKEDEDESSIELVKDEKIIKRVFDEYYDLLDKQS